MSTVKQMVKTLGFQKMKEIAKGRVKMMKAAKQSGSGKKEQDNFNIQYPANFTLMGGYVRGEGNYLNPAGLTASPSTLSAMGGCSTGWMIDMERDLTFIFLSSGFVPGFAHSKRLQRYADLALTAVVEE